MCDNPFHNIEGKLNGLELSVANSIVCEMDENLTLLSDCLEIGGDTQVISPQCGTLADK